MKVFTVKCAFIFFVAGFLSQTVNAPPMVFDENGKYFQFKAFHKTVLLFYRLRTKQKTLYLVFFLCVSFFNYIIHISLVENCLNVAREKAFYKILVLIENYCIFKEKKQKPTAFRRWVSAVDVGCERERYGCGFRHYINSFRRIYQLNCLSSYRYHISFFRF